MQMNRAIAAIGGRARACPAFVFGLLLVAILGACSGAPKNAAELLKRMPRHFQGEFREAGNPAAHKLVVEAMDLSVRDDHLLGFERIGYKIISPIDGSTILEDTVAVRGTISAPGGDVKIESLPAGESAPVAETVHGKLSSDLDTLEVSWTNGNGAATTFHAKAVR